MGTNQFIFNKFYLSLVPAFSYFQSRLIWLLLFSENSVAVTRKVSLDRKMRVVT